MRLTYANFEGYPKKLVHYSRQLGIYYINLNNEAFAGWFIDLRGIDF